MRAIVVITLLLSFVLPVSAEQKQSQPTSDQKAAMKRKGRTLTWIGISMVGAGALVIPVTSAPNNNSSDASTMTALSLITGGAALTLWGAHEKRRAAQPSTTFGVTVGRTNGVQVRRVW